LIASLLSMWLLELIPVRFVLTVLKISSMVISVSLSVPLAPMLSPIKMEVSLVELALVSWGSYWLVENVSRVQVPPPQPLPQPL